MDVLRIYDPPLEYEKFNQGPISDDVWSSFIDIVRLCCAYEYWSQLARYSARSRPPAPLYDESGYMRRKRRQEHRNETKRYEDHKFRAAFLAAEQLWQLVSLIQDRDGTPDWHLTEALFIAVGIQHLRNPITGHERAEFDVLALNEFDAATGVCSNAETTATRWRIKAGRP